MIKGSIQQQRYQLVNRLPTAKVGKTTHARHGLHSGRNRDVAFRWGSKLARNTLGNCFSAEPISLPLSGKVLPWKNCDSGMIRLGVGCPEARGSINLRVRSAAVRDEFFVRFVFHSQGATRSSDR